MEIPNKCTRREGFQYLVSSVDEEEASRKSVWKKLEEVEAWPDEKGGTSRLGWRSMSSTHQERDGWVGSWLGAASPAFRRRRIVVDATEMKKSVKSDATGEQHPCRST